FRKPLPILNILHSGTALALNGAHRDDAVIPRFCGNRAPAREGLSPKWRTLASMPGEHATRTSYARPRCPRQTVRRVIPGVSGGAMILARLKRANLPKGRDAKLPV